MFLLFYSVADYSERNAVVSLILLLVFELGVWHFSVSDSWQLELNGGEHALQSTSWWKKAIWMSCYVLEISSLLLLVPIAARTADQGMLEADRVFFGVCVSIVIFAGMIQQGLQVRNWVVL